MFNIFVCAGLSISVCAGCCVRWCAARGIFLQAGCLTGEDRGIHTSPDNTVEASFYRTVDLASDDTGYTGGTRKGLWCKIDPALQLEAGLFNDKVTKYQDLWQDTKYQDDGNNGTTA